MFKELELPDERKKFPIGTIVLVLILIGGFIYLFINRGMLEPYVQEVIVKPVIIQKEIKHEMLFPPKPTIDISELEKNIHNIINIEREKYGLSTLTWNEKLSEIARKHSEDMAKRNYFSHDTPEGNDFLYRYKQDGFKCEIIVGNFIQQGGENIFLNHIAKITYLSGNPAEYNTQKEIEESTVTGWMNSPGHRENILTDFWRSEGIGVAIADSGKIYITENFC